MRGTVTTIRILVAVESAGLSRVIEHLLSGQPSLQVVRADGPLAAPEAGGLHPDLIVTNARSFGKELKRAVDAIKRSSPGSKLIVIYSDEERDFEGRLRELA